MKFEHYLSAWAYARKHGIVVGPTTIKRVSFKLWSLES